MDEINTLLGLVEAVRDARTGGYDVEFNIRPNQERSRAGDGFFLVIDVLDSDPASTIHGQWWFWDDGTVMQVL